MNLDDYIRGRARLANLQTLHRDLSKVFVRFVNSSSPDDCYGVHAGQMVAMSQHIEKDIKELQTTFEDETSTFQVPAAIPV